MNGQVELIAQCLIEQETITNADVTRLIGPRPFSTNKDYEDFLSAGGKSWSGAKPVTPEVKDTEKDKEEGLEPGFSPA